MRRLYCILVLLGFYFFGAAQSPADSLLKKLGAAKDDTAKVNLLLQTGEVYLNSDPLTATAYYRQAAELSKKLNYAQGKFNSLIYYGSVFLVTGNYDSSLYYNQLSLEAATEMKDSFNIGMALFNIGISYREKSEFEKAISYCLQGRQIMEARHKPEIEVQMNDALQILYHTRSEYDKAIPFGKKAVQQSRELGMKALSARALVNLSLSYREKGMIDSGYILLKEAEKIAIGLNDTRLEAGILGNLSGNALKQNKLKEARAYAERNLVLANQIGSFDDIALSYRVFAICDLQDGKLASARENADKALAIAKEQGYKREQASLLRLRASIEFASHNMNAAFDYDDQSDILLESMVKEVISQQSADLEKKYETEKKESAIKKLEIEKTVQQLTIRQKNIFNYVLIGCAAVLLLISLLIYRNQKQKQKLQQQRINELETEKQLAATEAVLKGEEQERSRLAKDLHDGLGGILSGIKYSFTTMKNNLVLTPENQQAFERGVDMLDISIKEMRRVAHNMMPEALMKFGLNTALKDFCNDINQSGALKITYQSVGMDGSELPQARAIPVYRIVQELVNNIIKHAKADTAIVQLSRTDDTVSITVEDDGKGFAVDSLDKANGIGWSNIQSRVDYLKGGLNIQSKAGEGTSVHVEFKDV